MPSVFGGGGGGGVGAFAPIPGLGRAGNPPLRFENVEVRDAVDANDVR
jgi:hypothetical protein